MACSYIQRQASRWVGARSEQLSGTFRSCCFTVVVLDVREVCGTLLLHALHILSCCAAHAQYL